MRKRGIILTAGLILILLSTLKSQTIVGTLHDFSSSSWNTSGEICIVCHTPHNANTSVTNSPLWNHALTTQTFQVYTSATFKGVAGQPDEGSKLCLSCHDGTVALENYGTTTNGVRFMGGPSKIGTDLKNDHPISFVYDAALSAADPHVFNPTTQPSGMNGTVANDMLFANKMQCASCHDVHNGSGVDHLLRKSNAGSALCLTCHNR